MPSPNREKQKFLIPKQEALASKRAGPFVSESAAQTLQRYAEENVIFSWQFFDRTHDYFNCGSADTGWFITCMDTLRDVSAMKVVEFRGHSHRPLRVHPHDWKVVSAKYPLNQTMFKQIENDAYQFALSTAKGRIHGFLIVNVFYIVWLDPEHNLYPNKSHGGIVICDPPDDCYDCFVAEKLALESERETLYSEIDFHTIEIEQKKNRNDIY